MFTIFKTVIYFILANILYENTLSYLEKKNKNVYMNFLKQIIMKFDSKIIILILVIIFFNIY